MMVYAMAALVLLTTIVGSIALTRRIKCVKKGELDAKYFRVMSSSFEVPKEVEQSTRNFNNLFEVPVLFYVVCTLFIALNETNLIALICAWLFVLFRCWHSYIHLSYNKIIHRLTAFWLAVIAVLALWLNLVICIS